MCCAAPSYLARHGEPKEPEDLARHLCLTYEYSPNRNVWSFRDPKGGERQVRIAGPVHANNGRFNEALAAEGLGIAREPDFIVGPDVRAGRLTPILRNFEPPPLNIYVVYPSRRHLSAKVRAFADFLVERFATSQWGLPEYAVPPKATPHGAARADSRRGSSPPPRGAKGEGT